MSLSKYNTPNKIKKKSSIGKNMNKMDFTKLQEEFGANTNYLILDFFIEEERTLRAGQNILNQIQNVLCSKSSKIMKDQY